MADGKRSNVWLWVLVGGGSVFLFVLAVFTLVYISVRGEGEAELSGFGDKIAVVDLEGVIIEPKSVVDQLRRFGDDDSVKAIILHINTPGGGAAASQEIYDEVKRIRTQKHKRIVASVETLGASGGYYVASAADKIWANPASVVGSIGVISQWYNYGDLMRWAKIKEVLIKAGELKDTGDPTRDLTPQEREYLQGMIDNMHTQFIRAVAQGRGMKEEEVRKLATGRVWTGEQAKPLKLVDALGDFWAAVDDTAKSVGIQGKPNLVRVQPQRRTLLDLLFGDARSFLPDPLGLTHRNIGFYYLWK